MADGSLAPGSRQRCSVPPAGTSPTLRRGSDPDEEWKRKRKRQRKRRMKRKRQRKWKRQRKRLG